MDISISYTKNPDGWVTAQIAAFPEAISQGKDHDEARKNVLEAWRDARSGSWSDAEREAYEGYVAFGGVL